MVHQCGYSLGIRFNYILHRSLQGPDQAKRVMKSVDLGYWDDLGGQVEPESKWLVTTKIFTLVK